MIRHIVFFSAKDPKDRETVYEGLSLLTVIPECLKLEIGRNFQSDAVSPGGPDFIVYGEFADEKQLASYKAHPIYQEAIDIVRPLRDMRIAADFVSAWLWRPIAVPATETGGVEPMRIAIASDHAAVELKAELAAWLAGEGHDVADLGPESGARVDYPDYGYKLAEHVASGRAERGVALCGSGIGISIAVNRNPACRCALVGEPVSATLSREHNDANVIALGARLVGLDMAKACVTAFLKTPFAGGRHSQRVAKLAAPRVPAAQR